MNGERPGMAGPTGSMGGRPGGMGGGRPGMNIPRTDLTIPNMTPEEQTLAVFCQGLIASAEFRILN